ncbi:cobalt ECF transporter T component CbiQ [Chrysiogenes arsenatis]|uniref:cobalt ECF transporter T component CbiQ n=1 Tax=Chrysiogenes arsenatis TaxID=309797 RepID=UPI0003FF90E7|nr:cobalt ECF transporter T component CbiQ [Chrysiogenes arsenatis]
MSQTPPHIFALHHWHPRNKVLAAFCLAFTFSFVTNILLLPALLGFAALCAWMAEVTVKTLLQRLKLPSIMVIAMVLFLPFAGGTTPLVSILGLEVYREGLSAALLITLRFYAIMIVILAFLGTTPIHQTIQAMRSLGLPVVMADMAGLVLRYMAVIARDSQQMNTAIRLRGHHTTIMRPRSLKTLAWVWGSLCLRSYERSERVYHAMILRGYTLETQKPVNVRTSTLALSKELSAIAFCCVGITALQFFLGQ